jgi:hypothetical protein
MRRRLGMLVTVAAVVGACGGGATPTTPPTTAAVPAASAAASTPTGSGAGAGAASGGTLTVTYAGATKTYAITSCEDSDGTITVFAGDPQADGASVVISNDGLPPTMAGSLGGNTWVGSTNLKAARSGKSGTFSATDLGGTDTIEGSFTCN